MFYDYLFYKSYKLAQRSKNFDGTPVFGGVWFIMIGIMFNLFTVLFLLDIVFGSTIAGNAFFASGKLIFAILFLLSLIVYFKHSNRWERIIKKYEEEEVEGKRPVHPGVILVLYYLFSAGLLMVTAMYKNGDGIFA